MIADRFKPRLTQTRMVLFFEMLLISLIGLGYLGWWYPNNLLLFLFFVLVDGFLFQENGIWFHEAWRHFGFYIFLFLPVFPLIFLATRHVYVQLLSIVHHVLCCVFVIFFACFMVYCTMTDRPFFDSHIPTFAAMLVLAVGDVIKVFLLAVLTFMLYSDYQKQKNGNCCRENLGAAKNKLIEK